MSDIIFSAIFPYISFPLAVAGGIYLYYSHRFSYSDLISQFLEDPRLFWGSIPWQCIIFPLFLIPLFILIFYHGGSLWYPKTATPYFWTLTGLSLDPNTLTSLPGFMMFQIWNVFIIIALIIPFTRLVHMVTDPISYSWRPFQFVIWKRLIRRPPVLGPSGGGSVPASSASIETTRRGLMKWGTGILSLSVVLGIGIPFINALVGPIFRKRKPTWAKVTSLVSLPSGQPVSLTFASLNVDAYIRESVLHSVWALKKSDSEVTVYSSICPHLGCHYNWNPGTNHFECPCHGSVYAIDGKVLGGPAPRALDTLPVKIEGGNLYVEWEEFKIGIPQKVSI